MKYKIDKAAFDALPEAIQALYKGEGDTYTLQVEGIKTPEDVENVQAALRKEREEHDATKATLKTTAADLGTATDKVTVYENDDSKKLEKEQLVEFARLQRENEALTADNGTLKASFDSLTGEVTTNKIVAHLRSEAKGIIREDAIDNEIQALANHFVSADGKFLTNSTLGDKSGLEAKAYLTQFVEGRSYLVPTSKGGGAGGGGGSGDGTQTKTETDSGEISIFQTLD